MTIRKYRVVRDASFATKGTIVYTFMGHDYGCANLDSRNYGIEHISVTEKPDGSGPSFTVAINEVEEVRDG